MVWVQLALVPQPSVAVQVRAITSEAPQPVVTASAYVMATWPQASCAAATPVAFVLVSAGHSRTRSGGQVIDGRLLTVMVWTRLVLLPASSMAVQVRKRTLVPPQPLLTTSL